MNATIAIGFATTGITLLVTVTLFVVERILSRRAQREGARRDLVVRVLDAFDVSMRALARPAFVKAWVNSDLEFTLVIPRLLVDLPRKDRVIASWLMRQVQLMRLSVTVRERVEISTRVGQSLLRWQHRDIGAQWFATQLDADPVESSLKVPRKVKLRQGARDSWAWTQLFAVVASALFAIRQITGPSRTGSSPSSRTGPE